MEKDNKSEPHELILDHLRVIRADIAHLKNGQEQLKSDVLSTRRDINNLRGDIIRFEEKMVDLGQQVDRVNARLGLNETAQ